MPDAFDPAWEYWTPDPEVAEAMGDCAAAVANGTRLMQIIADMGEQNGRLIEANAKLAAKLDRLHGEQLREGGSSG